MNTDFDEANHSSRERNSDLEDRLCDLEQMVGIVDDLADATLSDNSVYVGNSEKGESTSIGDEWTICGSPSSDWCNRPQM
jgi:hypothetical protein